MSAEDAADDAFYAALLDDDAEQLYERAPCGYLSTTPDGMIVKVNQTFLHADRIPREDLVGRRTFAELLTAGGRIYHETHYAPMLRMQGSVREIALDLVRRRRPAPARAGQLPSSSATRRAARWWSGRRSSTPPSGASTSGSCCAAKQRAEESEARATALARTLQQTLIPPAPPAIPGPRRGRRLPAGGRRRRGRRRLLRRLPDRRRATGWWCSETCAARGWRPRS